MTTDFKGFKGKAKRIDDPDIPRLAHIIGVGEDELHAFMDVETGGGTGFDPEGRPKILFEPHVFYRNLSGAKLDKAVRQGLAAQKWGTIPYGKESAQYPRLALAMQIDETAALKAASWGLGQILGENHKMVGYATVQDMVKAFMDDAEHHLAAMIDYLINAGIDDDLREHDWVTVARVYNGPGYRKNRYDTKMAERFRWWQGKRDTAWSPDERQEAKAEAPVAAEQPKPIPAPTPTPVPPTQRVFVKYGWLYRVIAAIFGWAKGELVEVKDPGQAPGLAAAPQFAAIAGDQQPFFGTVIAGVAAKAAIDVVGRVTERVLKRPDVTVSDRKAEEVAGEIAVKAAPQVIEAMKQNPSVAKAINGEPLLKSGFFWLGVFGVIGSVGTLGQLYFDGEPTDLETYFAALTALGAAISTIVRRTSLQT